MSDTHTAEEQMPLYMAALFAFAEKFGKPLPKHKLEIGDKDTGWYMTLEDYDVTVYWLGWPFAVIGYYGGEIGDGELANETTFRAWLDSL